MTCFHPLKAFKIGVNVDTGKDMLRIRSYDQQIELAPDGRIIEDFIPIPCGQCIGCRLEYSRQWATRMMLEAKDHEETWFLTLTYDDVNVPVNEWIDFDTGEVNESLTLKKRDWQLFLKRFRKVQEKRFGRKLRFFMSGEYGDQYSRPHFHAIVFGAHFDDLVLYTRKGSYEYYNSEMLSNAWNKGFAVVAKATFETCAYVGRYVTKKLNGKLKSFYAEHGLEPEFALMSRKPGIGRTFYEFNKRDLFHFSDEDSDDFLPERIVLPNGKSVAPPKYFDKIFEVEDVVGYELMKKQRREVMDVLESLKSEQSDLDYLSRLAASEDVCKNRLLKLQRRFENGSYEK